MPCRPQVAMARLMLRTGALAWVARMFLVSCGSWFVRCQLATTRSTRSFTVSRVRLSRTLLLSFSFWANWRMTAQLKSKSAFIHCKKYRLCRRHTVHSLSAVMPMVFMFSQNISTSPNRLPSSYRYTETAAPSAVCM